MADVMLLSSSTVHGYRFLEHARDAIREHLSGREDLVFVPFALADHVSYVEAVGEALRGVCNVRQAEESAIDSAEAIFVGGGNTFRLLKALQERELLAPIRHRVANGVPYIGSSAGTNVACPTIRTTNDMPIVEPHDFNALGLVPFQVNAHFVEGALTLGHMGESRQQRIAEFHEENDVPVVALREAARLVLTGDTLRLGGDGGAVLFRKGADAEELSPGDDLSHLLLR